MMEEYERLASEVNYVLLHQKPSNYDKIRHKLIIFADMLLSQHGGLSVLLVFPCYVTVWHSSCWSGSAAPPPGWRTELLRRRWQRCRGSWRTSGITGASTSPRKCRRSVNWKSTSTPCRPSYASATVPLSCPPRARWYR